MQDGYDWIYSIQKRHAEQMGFIIATSNSEDLTGVVASHKKAVDDQLKRLGREQNESAHDLVASKLLKQTPLDEPLVRQMLERSLIKILETLAKSGIEDREFMISTLPSGSISALCVANSWENRKYILIDSDLTNFTLLLSKIVSLCFPPKSSINYDFTSRRCIELARSNKQFRLEVCKLFYAASIIGYASASKPWILPDDRVFLAEVFADNMNTFVLGHEVAHGILGHFDAPKACIDLSDGIVPDGSAIIMSHEDEYAADRTGLLLSIGVASQTEVSPLYPVLASYTFLKGVELLESSCAVFDDRVSDLLSTHPNAADRAAKLLEVACEIAPSDNSRNLLRARAKRVNQVLSSAKRHVLPFLQAQKNAGVKPRRKKMQAAIDLDRPQILGFLPGSGQRVIQTADKLQQSIAEFTDDVTSVK